MRSPSTVRYAITILSLAAPFTLAGCDADEPDVALRSAEGSLIDEQVYEPTPGAEGARVASLTYASWRRGSTTPP